MLLPSCTFFPFQGLMLFAFILLFWLIKVLQRKTEEATMATKRLKELLEAKKASSREMFGKENKYKFLVNNVLLVPKFDFCYFHFI